MLIADRTKTAVGICFLSILLGLLLIAGGIGIIKADATEGSPATADNGEYVVLAWNDLGMHCYNRDFKDLAVLPPFNTLWAQVIQVGESPQIITTGVTSVHYHNFLKLIWGNVLYPKG